MFSGNKYFDEKIIIDRLRRHRSSITIIMRCELSSARLCEFVLVFLSQFRCVHSSCAMRKSCETTNRISRTSWHTSDKGRYIIVPVESRSRASCAVLFSRALSSTTLNENRLFDCSLSWSEGFSL